MIQMTKWAFKNKAAVLFVTVLVLLMGAISYATLPMEFMPAADNPMVTIVVLGQGTGAEELQDSVTGPIERAVSAVKSKREIYSTTGDGFSKVDMMFEPGADMKQAKADVQEAIGAIALPQGVSKPFVVQLNTSMIPIADISIGFEDGLTKANMALAEQEIKPHFQNMNGVASVGLYGVSDPQVSITVDNAKLAAKHIPFQAVMGALQGQNTAVAVGEKTIDGKTSNIKVIGQIDGLAQLKALPVGAGVSLGDVAIVEIASQESNLTRVNGKDILVMIITKDMNANAVAIMKDVQKKVEQVNGEYPKAAVDVFFATTDMVENSVNSMMKEVLLGALFATIVIMMFLRNLRTTFITIVSIPLSLAMTLFLLKMSGVTLNILTLGGVAVAVGRLVDDSIVVIENIYRKMQKGEFSVQSIISSTKEVAAAITSSTLTTVAVFLPIGLVSGGLQDFIRPFALTITYSLLSSLIVAMTVVPLMSAVLLKNAKLPEHKSPERFVRFLRWSLNHKAIVLLTVTAIFFGSIVTFVSLPKGSVDSSAADYIQVTLDYPNDTPIDTIKEKALELEQFLLKQEEAKYVYLRLGNSADMAQYGEVGSPTTVSVMAIMKKNVNAENFINQVRTQKDHYPDASLTAGAGSLLGSSGTSVFVDVIGNDQDDLAETAARVQSAIEKVDGVEKVYSNQDAKKRVYALKVDPAKANAGQTAGQLAMLLNRMPIGTIALDGKNAPVYMEPAFNPAKPSDIEQIPVATGTGEIVPVSEIASIQAEEHATTLLHKAGKPFIRITADVDPKRLSIIADDIQASVIGSKSTDGIEVPKGVNVFVGGASEEQASDFTDMFLTMMVSIGIVYLIMVITFKTFRAPLTILFSLPLAAIGAILGLLVSRIPVDLTALLGALMLIGVVVTNAIVLIDRVKHNESTMIIREALLEAAATRMRPIFMTAVATIFAMTPLLFKQAESFNLVSQSLAVVVIGGLAAATLLTLIVIPVIYELLHFSKSRKQRNGVLHVADSPNFYM